MSWENALVIALGSISALALWLAVWHGIAHLFARHADGRPRPIDD